ncbi:hypothetical protein [Thomasclavelia sp.]
MEEVLEKYLLGSLNQDFDNFIVERVAKGRDKKSEQLLNDIYDAIEEYKNISDSKSIRHHDKVVAAINDLIIYYESTIYKKAFVDGVSLPFLNYIDK